MQNPKSKNSEAVNDGAPRLVSKCEVLALLGGAVGYSTLWGWMREGKFPLAIELGPPGKRSTTIAWYRDDVRVGCAPWKGGVFQWVQAPPGDRSSRKQSEQSWR